MPKTPLLDTGGYYRTQPSWLQRALNAETIGKIRYRPAARSMSSDNVRHRLLNAVAAESRRRRTAR